MKCFCPFYSLHTQNLKVLLLGVILVINPRLYQDNVCGEMHS